MTYYVGRNYCKCHPETCCCNDFAIYSEDGEKAGSYFFKTDAEIVCNNMNKVESTNERLISTNKRLTERIRQLEI